MKRCPHCIVAINEIEKIAKKLGLSCALYDVYRDDQAKLADEMVRRYGDWSDDYIVPQIFFETNDGSIVHVLTGYPEGVQFTKRAVYNLLESEFFRQLVQDEMARPVNSDSMPGWTCLTEDSCSRQPYSGVPIQSFRRTSSDLRSS